MLHVNLSKKKKKKPSLESKPVSYNERFELVLSLVTIATFGYRALLSIMETQQRMRNPN